MITFNAGQTAAGKFDGLHLDIEPQALTEFKTGTLTEKRDYLNLLRDTYALVRNHFVSNSLPDFPIYADLPVWFDSLDAIGWTDEAERDAWFTAISTNLTGISFMPFDRNSFSSINRGVSWERTSITNASVRIGLEADIGASNTWATSLDFNAMMETYETNYGLEDAIDIQSYRQWREALIEENFGGTDLSIDTAPGVTALQFNTESNLTYSVLHSTNLCNWLEINRFIAAKSIFTNLIVSTDPPVGYWKISHLTPIE